VVGEDHIEQTLSWRQSSGQPTTCGQQQPVCSDSAASPPTAEHCRCHTEQ